MQTQHRRNASAHIRNPRRFQDNFRRPARNSSEDTQDHDQEALWVSMALHGRPWGANGLRLQWSEHVGHIVLGSQGGVCREKGRVGGEGFTASTQTMEHINSLAHVPLLLLHFLFARATSISLQRPKVQFLPILPFKISFAQFPNVHFHPCIPRRSIQVFSCHLSTPPFHTDTPSNYPF